MDLVPSSCSHFSNWTISSAPADIFKFTTVELWMQSMSPQHDILRLSFYEICLLAWPWCLLFALILFCLLLKEISLFHFSVSIGCTPVSSGALQREYITREITISQCHLSFELIREYTLIYWQNHRYPDDEASLFHWIKVVYPFCIANTYWEPYCGMVSVITKMRDTAEIYEVNGGPCIHLINIYEVPVPCWALLQALETQE